VSDISQTTDFNKIECTNLLAIIHFNSGYAMAQAVSRRPLIAEARVCARVSSCGVYGGQSGTETVFLEFVGFHPVSIIPPWLSMLICHLGNEQ
jgi:hypothetical protein